MVGFKIKCALNMLHKSLQHGVVFHASQPHEHAVLPLHSLWHRCRALAGVEAALDAREGQLQDSWQLLQASAAALKNGDVAGAATASAIVGMVRH
jgi:hypothetical protein